MKSLQSWFISTSHRRYHLQLTEHKKPKELDSLKLLPNFEITESLHTEPNFTVKLRKKHTKNENYMVTFYQNYIKTIQLNIEGEGANANYKYNNTPFFEYINPQYYLYKTYGLNNKEVHDWVDENYKYAGPEHTRIFMSGLIYNSLCEGQEPGYIHSYFGGDSMFFKKLHNFLNQNRKEVKVYDLNEELDLSNASPELLKLLKNDDSDL